jgi:large subunit ribosomal protein L18
MNTMTYNPTLKRNRQRKTNYRKRASLLLSRRHFIIAKISDQNVSCQFLKPTLKGDIVICSAHSRELRKYGWKGSMNNLPACYLTGFLLGKKSLAKGTDNAILYTGRDSFTSRVAACLKGIVAAGVNVPVSEDNLPSDDRTNGKHIAEYAKILRSDEAKYNSIFSTLIKDGLNPEEYPSHSEATKQKILENFTAKAKSEQR